MGSVPAASRGFLFEGWFTDAACTVPATGVDAATGRLVPQKAATVWTEQTYYAKFVATETTLTLHTVGVTDVDQAFLFRITGKPGTDTAGVELTVAVMGNESITVDKLPTGEYVVTELSAWSWRYQADAAQKNVTLTYDGENTLTYTYTRENGLWLDGNTVVDNLF